MRRETNLWLMVIALLAITATIIGTTIVYYGLFQERVREDLSVSAKLLRDTRYFESVDIDTEKIDLSTDIEELRVTWIDRDGTVLYDNDTSAKQLANHLDRPEILEALKNGKGASVRRSDTMNENTFYYAVLLENGTVLRVATDAKNMGSVFASAAPTTALILLGIIGLCVVVSHVLTKKLVDPIEKMAKALENNMYEAPYKELEPFAEMVHTQHDEVLSAARARQDFTANVSHELKTPLTAISGYAELLESGVGDEEQIKHFSRAIRKNSSRLLSLINDIIRLSELDRIEKTPSFEKMDLYETVSECMEGLAVNAKQRGIALMVAGEPCTIQGNKDMIKELTENLVQNAIRYNNEGGKVEVTVEQKERPVLVVKDNGIGIPASEQQRIFERFYRVDKSRSKETGGTGLGLSIVKHIVEIHDASLELDSAPGVGTTISVRF